MTFKPVPGSEFTLECELVLLAMGFTGPERSAIDQLGVKLSDRGTVSRDESWMTNVAGVFTAGDMQRGQSLIVWAIAEGRSAARGLAGRIARRLVIRMHPRGAHCHAPLLLFLVEPRQSSVDSKGRARRVV